MIKPENPGQGKFIARICKATGFARADVRFVVSKVWDTIIEMLAEGKSADIQYFGTFWLVHQKPAMRLNPRNTSQRFMRPAYTRIVFYPGKGLKARVKDMTPTPRRPPPKWFAEHYAKVRKKAEPEDPML